MDLSVFSVLYELVPYILVIGGLFAVLRIVKLFFRHKHEGAVKALEFFGFFIGLLLLITGAVSIIGGIWSLEVWVLLIITGLGQTLRPISKVPFSALFGLVAGLACVGLLYWFLPLPSEIFGISSMWIYLAVFLFPAIIFFIVFKFLEDLTKLFGMVLGASPVLAILGLLCIAEGLLLLLNMSLLSFLG